MDAWICEQARALVLRLAIGGDRPVFVGLTDGPTVPAVGGLDLVEPGLVVALRVICDGMMTYVAGRLRLDLASWAIVLVGTGPDRTEVDDRLCDLAVALSEPGGYDARQTAAARIAARGAHRQSSS